MLGGALTLLYGVVNLVEALMMVAGTRAVPPSLGHRALQWHLWLCDPYWLLGGALFLGVTARLPSRGRDVAQAIS